MSREETIKTIVHDEWDMFTRVHNMGGTASCQMDPQTFGIMRSSQFAAWDDALLESYAADLVAAKAGGRNLMTEKYARMMESTSPMEYADLAASLPPLDAGIRECVERIVAANVRWKEELGRKYPHLNDHGRPLRTSEDSLGVASFETYMRGELQTYSLATLTLYDAAVQRRLARGESEAEANVLAQVRQYGFANLEDAEQYLAREDKA